MYSLSLILYDSMLVDVTTVGRMDSVSSSGYAWGYIGSCVPFMACLVLILRCDSFGITMSTAMTVSMVVIAVWWVAASLPLIRGYVQRNHVDDGGNALSRLWNTIRDSKKDRRILLFLLAFFFYIDGVYTIIEMATAYGEA
ncbi:MAG: MFS transporter, partial [Candidatus Methanomethylophilaceae archaeon]|nr:MFS transporter [Candidatus Methanomethylophilaceae archaeon]